MDWASLERIVLELVVLSVLNWLPARRLGREIKLLRVDVRRFARELTRHRGRATRRMNAHDERLEEHETRLDAHDKRAGIDTRPTETA